jgi:hypothetical protein
MTSVKARMEAAGGRMEDEKMRAEGPRWRLGKQYPVASVKARMEAASRPMKSAKVWRMAEPTEAESRPIEVREGSENGRADGG